MEINTSLVALDFILRVETYQDRWDAKEKRKYHAEHGYFDKPVRVVKIGCKVGETFVTRHKGQFEVFLITDIPGPYHYKVVAVR